LILFGPGRLPRLMKDIGEGVKGLRDGLKGKEVEEKKEKKLKNVTNSKKKTASKKKK